MASSVLHLREVGAPVEDAHADDVRALTGTLEDAVRRVLTYLAPNLADDARPRATVWKHAREIAG